MLCWAAYLCLVWSLGLILFTLPIGVLVPSVLRTACCSFIASVWHTVLMALSKVRALSSWSFSSIPEANNYAISISSCRSAYTQCSASAYRSVIKGSFHVKSTQKMDDPLWIFLKFGETNAYTEKLGHTKFLPHP